MTQEDIEIMAHLVESTSEHVSLDEDSRQRIAEYIRNSKPIDSYTLNHTDFSYYTYERLPDEDSNTESQNKKATFRVKEYRHVSRIDEEEVSS